MGIGSLPKVESSADLDALLHRCVREERWLEAAIRERIKVGLCKNIVQNPNLCFSRSFWSNLASDDELVSMLGFGSAVIEVVGKRQSYFDLGCSTSSDSFSIYRNYHELNSYALKHGKADDIDMDIDLRAADA